MADYGLKISKAGQDVKTATFDNLILSSQRNCLKVKNPQTTTITISGGSGSRTVAHGLSFAPIVIAYLNYQDIYMIGGDNTIRAFPSCLAVGGATFYDIISMEVDATYIYFTGANCIDGTYIINYFVSETESAS